MLTLLVRNTQSCEVFEVVPLDSRVEHGWKVLRLEGGKWDTYAVQTDSPSSGTAGRMGRSGRIRKLSVLESTDTWQFDPEKE